MGIYMVIIIYPYRWVSHLCRVCQCDFSTKYKCSWKASRYPLPTPTVSKILFFLPSGGAKKSDGYMVNHYITHLDQAGCESCHIMEVSSHKSESTAKTNTKKCPEAKSVKCPCLSHPGCHQKHQNSMNALQKCPNWTWRRCSWFPLKMQKSPIEHWASSLMKLRNSWWLKLPQQHKKS